MRHCAVIFKNSNVRQTKPELQPNHLDYLDGWRGLAIAFLLIGHFIKVPGINFGEIGVSLFFVLSGHLMGKILFLQNTPIPTFYKRRISRIIPAHLFFISTIVTYFSIFDIKINWPEVITAALFINNYFPGSLGNNEMPFGHIWSLSVEEHSYILLSLCALFARKNKNSKIILITLTTLSGFFCWIYWINQSEINVHRNWMRTEIASFGILSSASLLLTIHKIKLPKIHWLTYPTLLGIGITMHWWSIPKPIATTVGVGSMALCVNLLHSAPEVIKKLLSFKPLTYLGTWSFSIYLWQQPFYLTTYHDNFPTFLAILLSITAGILSYYLIENPIRSYLNHRWAKLIDSEPKK